MSIAVSKVLRFASTLRVTPLPVKADIACLLKEPTMIRLGSPPASAVAAKADFSKSSVNARAVPATRMSEPSPVADVAPAPSEALDTIQDSMPAVTRAAEAVPADLALLANADFSISRVNSTILAAT